MQPATARSRPKAHFRQLPQSISIKRLALISDVDAKATVNVFPHGPLTSEFSSERQVFVSPALTFDRVRVLVARRHVMRSSPA